MSKNHNKKRPDAVDKERPAVENTEKSLNGAEEPAEENTAAAEAATDEVRNEAPAVEEAPEETPAESAPEVAEPEEEKEYSAAEGTDANLLSEFAPRPINIPNVDLEKEKRRQEKRSKKRTKEKKKVEARKKKSRKKRLSSGQKVAMGIASFIFFLIFIATMTVFEAAISVRLTTSSYAIHMAVKNMDTGEIPISQNSNGVSYIPDYATLGTERSSSRAALVDMIRDNAEGNVIVTYSEILSSIRGSGMDEFIENGLSSAADHLLLDKPYKPITGEDIAGVVRGSSAMVYDFTGRKLTDADYDGIARYFDSTGKLDDVSAARVDAVPLRRYTKYSKRLLSLPVLGMLLLINILLIVVLTVLGRRNSSGHIPIGWGFILSGLAVIAGGLLMRPAYDVAAPFLQSVLNNYFNFFTTSVVVIAGIFTVVGAFIFLVGNAADREE